MSGAWLNNAKDVEFHTGVKKIIFHIFDERK